MLVCVPLAAAAFKTLHQITLSATGLYLYNGFLVFSLSYHTAAAAIRTNLRYSTQSLLLLSNIIN